jgi:CRP-like cAMP-binding protein
MTTAPNYFRQNNILDSLPSADYERLFPHIERVKIARGEILYEPGDVMNYAYFPLTCIMSLISTMKNGNSSEIALVGNEGMVGIALFMDGAISPNRVIVRSAGYAYRIEGHLVTQEFNRFGGRRKGAFHNLLLRYTQVMIAQMAQMAVCNRHHALDQQLCRWLLLSLDRLVSNELLMTHELIANMLGVRREGVSEAAGKLQRAGLIYYNRGHITVLDRPGLEVRACECYQIMKRESDRLLPILDQSLASLNRFIIEKTSVRHEHINGHEHIKMSALRGADIQSARM